MKKRVSGSKASRSKVKGLASNVQPKSNGFTNGSAHANRKKEESSSGSSTNASIDQDPLVEPSPRTQDAKESPGPVTKLIKSISSRFSAEDLFGALGRKSGSTDSLSGMKSVDEGNSRVGYHVVHSRVPMGDDELDLDEDMSFLSPNPFSSPKNIPQAHEAQELNGTRNELDKKKENGSFSRFDEEEAGLDMDDINSSDYKKSIIESDNTIGNRKVDEDTDDNDQDDASSGSAGSGGSNSKKKVRFSEPPTSSEVFYDTLDMPLSTKVDQRKVLRTFDSLGSDEVATPIRTGSKLFYVPSHDTLLSMDAQYEMPQFQKPATKPLSPAGRKDLLSQLSRENELRPEVNFEKATKKVVQVVGNVDAVMSDYLAKSVIIHSRSSGMDKLASFLQYGAMSLGDLRLRFEHLRMIYAAKPETLDRFELFRLAFGKVKPLKRPFLQPWVALEDSMSSGRKVLRLGKWLKELERVRLAIILPDAFLGKINNPVIMMFRRFLTVSMHIFSATYYFFDNLVWTAQIGFTNSGVKELEERLDKLYKETSPSKEIIRKTHIEYIKKRTETERRIDKWKYIKDYASLYRLLIACINCSLQLQLLGREKRRINLKCEEKSRITQIILNLQKQGFCDDEILINLRKEIKAFKYYNEIDIQELDFAQIKSISALEKLRDERLSNLKAERQDQLDELTASFCNLMMTLSRLRFAYFKEIPLHMVGAFGVIAAMIGISKNWPKEVKKKK